MPKMGTTVTSRDSATTVPTAVLSPVTNSGGGANLTGYESRPTPTTEPNFTALSEVSECR